MLIPIKCFTCNFPISTKYKEYLKIKDKHSDANAIFKELRVKRYCCKKTLLTHVDIIDKIKQNI